MVDWYGMAQGPDFNPFESFMKGRQARYEDKLNQNKLAELARADQARPLIGQALMGDKNALSSLSGLDNQAYMDVANFQSNQAKAQRDISDAEKQQIVGALYAADTPEKWQQTINYLKSQGHDIEPQAMDFNNRDAILGASIGPKGMQDAKQWELGYGVDKMNAETSRMNAEGKTQQPRTQITEVNGHRVLVDLNTGAVIQDLGTAPVRGRSGPSATELKAQYEAEDNNAMLDASLQTLDDASTLLGTDEKPGNVLEGYGAGIRGDISSKAPGIASKLGIATPDQGLDTAEFGRIMNGEAIKQMSEQLKGATTDRELAVFVKNLADPSVPNSIKRKTLARMRSLLQRKRDLNDARVKEIRASGQQGQAGAPTQQDMGGASQGWNEQDIPQIIQDATDAIQQGADPEAVIQDMVNNGVDPDYARLLLNGQ